MKAYFSQVFTLLSVFPLTLTLSASVFDPLALALTSGSLPPSSDISSSSYFLETPYILGAGDSVNITVFELPQYSGEFEISVDGSIHLPVVGKVQVDGLAIEEASVRISEYYSKILNAPLIEISITNRRDLNIALSGEIQHPGSYVLEASNAELPTLTEAIEEAGGIRMSADVSNIEILRQNQASPFKIVVDLLDLIQNGNISSDITLRDGDRIIIPSETNPNLETLSALSNASFRTTDSSSINIAIVGEVFRPGPHVILGSAQTGDAGETGQVQNRGEFSTVVTAIQVAGGIKPQADLRNVEVRRSTRSGTEQIITVNLWKLLQDGDLNQDLILQDGDTVIVPTASDTLAEDAAFIASASFSPDTIQVHVVGEVVRPGIVNVPPNTPLNQTVLTAGGFNNRARRRDVELIRLNSNGTVSAREIAIDFSQDTNEESNPALQNNDVVIVGRSSITKISDNLGALGGPVGRFVNLITTPFTLLRLLD